MESMENEMPARIRKESQVELKKKDECWEVENDKHEEHEINIFHFLDS